KQYLYFRRLPIPQTGALAAAESGLRLLTQAAIEKQTLTPLPSLPNFGGWFIFANNRFSSPAIRSRMF
ncbi:hypothetical protein, partial [Sphingomonas sp. Leaf230]|uniref:hypothetical protein n=1 Tax=Sphingomonas sp. Leaf230 TaxID=1735694 RepID=UPI000A4A3308